MVVRGARTEKGASDIAKTVIGSPLLKTAVYGEDPNWGRVLAAAGRGRRGIRTRIRSRSTSVRGMNVRLSSITGRSSPTLHGPSRP